MRVDQIVFDTVYTSSACTRGTARRTPLRMELPHHVVFSTAMIVEGVEALSVPYSSTFGVRAKFNTRTLGEVEP